MRNHGSSQRMSDEMPNVHRSETSSTSGTPGFQCCDMYREGMLIWCGDLQNMHEVAHIHSW